MGKVVANACTSLDGYIAKQDNTIGLLFDWFQKGTVEVPAPRGDWALRLTAESASYRGEWMSQLGALVCGRTLFDLTDGWDGRVDLDVPVVVVTHQAPTEWVDGHPDAPFSFVTDGVEAAIRRAQAIAGDQTVAVTGGSIAGQCLQLGLLDEVAVDLVPVVMGGGRPFFGQLTAQDVPLGDPTTCIQGDGVIHLVFPVIR
jgi:dihydrofolate reductase